MDKHLLAAILHEKMRNGALGAKPPALTPQPFHPNVMKPPSLVPPTPHQAHPMGLANPNPSPVSTPAPSAPFPGSTPVKAVEFHPTGEMKGIQFHSPEQPKIPGMPGESKFKKLKI